MSKNNNVISEFKKLNNALLVLETTEATLQDYFSRHDAEISTIYFTLKQKRENEIEKIKHKIAVLQSTLNDIHHKTDDFQNINLQLLKKEMIEVQDNIIQFNLHCKNELENLKQEEILLTEQLRSYEMKIPDWEKTINTDIITLKAKAKSAIKKKFTFEVEEYLNFINENGHYGGWTVEDHNLFLKVRTKMKNVQNTAKYLTSLMPDKSVDEILKHEEWYGKYQYLREKQRCVIKKWKSEKMPLQVGKTEMKSELNIYNKNECDREKNLEKLTAWKEEKKRKLQEKEEKEKREKEELKRQIAENRKIKNKTIKEKVLQWKEEKEIQLLNEKVQREFVQTFLKKQKSIEASRAIKQFQSKDDEFIEKMKNKRSSNVKSTTELIRSKTCAPRDPKRLLQPTKQWIERSKRTKNQDDNNLKTPMDIVQVPKLCLPYWRKNIN